MESTPSKLVRCFQQCPARTVPNLATTGYLGQGIADAIDIIVKLEDIHCQALADAYPLPRYYADPFQMQNAMEIGSSFNIIDTERGEKADLFPLSMDSRHLLAFENRIRQDVELPGLEPFSVWAARPEDASWAN